MASVSLSLACDLNSVTRPVSTGRVSPEGIELNFLALTDVNDMFRRMIRHQEFDISEMSMSSYLMALDQGHPEFVGIPVFPSRVFRHGFVFVNAEAKIKDPQSLRGKKVGVPSYSMTSALWERAIIEHEYGVEPAEMDWYQRQGQGTEDDDPLTVDLPDGVNPQGIPSETSLSEMLANGSLDALFSSSVPDSYDGEGVKRLFANYREVEIEYFERTGFFPIMHLIVIKKAVYERNPWIANELVNIFQEAKELALGELDTTSRRKITVPWIYEHIERVHELMGPDYWSYGIESNYDLLEAMTNYSFEQGLTNQRLPVEELFAPNTY